MSCPRSSPCWSSRSAARCTFTRRGRSPRFRSVVSPLAKLVEAALFASARPLTVEELVTLDPQAGAAAVRGGRPRGRADRDCAGVAIPDAAGVRRGDRSRAIRAASAALEPGRPRDAGDHRLPAAGGTPRGGRDPGSGFGRRDREAGRAGPGGDRDPGRRTGAAVAVRHYAAVPGDPRPQGPG